MALLQLDALYLHLRYSFLPLSFPSLSFLTPLAELSSSAQRRDALRLFCLLLPHANRDTLQALLQFLSRVALHSDGIILIDGTQVGVVSMGGGSPCFEIICTVSPVV